MRRADRTLAASALAAMLAVEGAAAAELTSGDYALSDELGGFRLVAVSGTGTSDDPLVVVEEIEEAAPVTLVIRRHGAASRLQAGVGQLTLDKVVVNRSRRIWSGFDMELQEILKKPSDYGDGLSFKQFAAEPPDIASDTFLENERDFEPYDRIRFQNGHVDPDATARFHLTITDPTPTPVFYLVQEPKLLSANIGSDTRYAEGSRPAAR